MVRTVTTTETQTDAEQNVLFKLTPTQLLLGIYFATRILFLGVKNPVGSWSYDQGRLNIANWGGRRGGGGSHIHIFVLCPVNLF